MPRRIEFAFQVVRLDKLPLDKLKILDEFVRDPRMLDILDSNFDMLDFGLICDIAIFSFVERFVERFVLVVDKIVLCKSGGGCCSFILTVTVFCII